VPGVEGAEVPFNVARRPIGPLAERPE
jgi:hypothetical protein